MSLPSQEFWRALTWTERAACTIGNSVAQRPLLRRVTTEYQGRVVVPVLGQTVNDRIHIHGVEHLPEAGSLIFAANHRSYFDLYAVLLVTWWHYRENRHLYCPVRTGFFYERPVGVALNLAVCGHAMYPPVFRDKRSRALNQYAVDLAVGLLDDDPRSILAMHPEGRRNSDPDPYSYLPPKPGIGRIALRSQRPIIPIYVGGLPPKFGQLIRERASGHGTPVRVRFGPEVDVSDLYGRATEAEAHHETARRTMAAVAALGEADRAFMATLKR